MTALRLTGIDGRRQIFSDSQLAELASSDGVVHVGALIDRVDIPASTTHCTAISEGGAYRASIPIDVIASGGQLVVRRNGAQLSVEDGGPYRLTVIDGTTLCWNVKAVAELRLSVGKLPDDVPENPPH